MAWDDPREQLRRQQRSDEKELQCKIQRMKATVPKNDKKRRKEMKAEIERLEEQMLKDHAQEMVQLKLMGLDCPTDEDSDADIRPDDMLVNLYAKMEMMRLGLVAGGDDDEQPSESDEPPAAAAAPVRVSKAQKRRERKERDDREREERARLDEIEGASHVRHKEKEQLDKLFKEEKLRVEEVPSDGDCMYRAVLNQLRRQPGLHPEMDVPKLRQAAANEMRQNPEGYAPFMESKKGDDVVSDAEFEAYCKEIETTARWGGNLELNALAARLNVDIHVLQATGPKIQIGGKKVDPQSKPLLLSYHRHAYHLGEHYNSLVPI